MNKRIKLKKGILHKKCDESCINYFVIKENQLITNNICIGCKCKYRDNVIPLLAKNFAIQTGCTVLYYTKDK